MELQSRVGVRRGGGMGNTATLLVVHVALNPHLRVKLIKLAEGAAPSSPKNESNVGLSTGAF